MSERARRLWSGPKDRGWTYTATEVLRVRDTLKARHTGRVHAVSLEDLSAETRVAGRPLRAIISEIDGDDMLVAYTKGRVFVAEFIEDGIGWTRRLQAITAALVARARRRVSFTGTLPARQGSFGFDDDDDDDDDDEELIA